MFQLNRLDLGDAPVEKDIFLKLVLIARETFADDHPVLKMNHKAITPYFRAHLEDIHFLAKHAKTPNAAFDHLEKIGTNNVFCKLDKQLKSLLICVYLLRDPHLLITFCEAMRHLLKFYNEASNKNSRTASTEIKKLLEVTFEGDTQQHILRPKPRQLMNVETLESIQKICSFDRVIDESTSMQERLHRIRVEMRSLFVSPSDSDLPKKSIRVS